MHQCIINNHNNNHMHNMDNNGLEQVMREYNESLRALRDKVNDSLEIARDSAFKLGSVIRDSHLRSTITMLESDIALRSVINKNR